VLLLHPLCRDSILQFLGEISSLVQILRYTEAAWLKFFQAISFICGLVDFVIARSEIISRMRSAEQLHWQFRCPVWQIKRELPGSKPRSIPISCTYYSPGYYIRYQIIYLHTFEPKNQYCTNRKTPKLLMRWLKAIVELDN
jgi:hypothetical protein